MRQLLSLVLLLLCCCVPLSRGHNVARILAHRSAAAPGPAADSSNSSADAPSPPDLIALMSKKGCKMFADLLGADKSGVAKNFEEAAPAGLTVFCPNDDAVRAFLPKLKNLTADDKASLLLYHGVPVHYSVQSLKSSNGVMNTLATDGAQNYNFTVQNDGEVVTLRSAGPTARIKGTVVDKDPLAVYVINQVLEPLELFKPAEVPAPAPAPEAVADAPAKAKGPKKGKHAAAAPAADGPEGPVADDQKAADENASRRDAARLWAVVAAAAAAAAVVV